MKKILHISDTHTYHRLLTIPPVDLIIHSGDGSNPKDPYTNEHEIMNFLNWYAIQDAQHKVYVPGNHDTSIEKGLVKKEEFTDRGITLLIDEFITIEGIKIWGSPWTPDFGHGWAWNKDRSKLYDIWQQIPDDTDIIITHGPPRGILDLAYDREKIMEFCGCRALYKRILEIKPKFSMFGHIHNNNDVVNAGTRTVANCPTIFSNGSVMTDGKFHIGPTSFGNLFEI